MFVKSTLFKKGIVLLSIPLCVQLAFIWVLAEVQRGSDEAHAWSMHSKEVLERTQYALRSISNAENGIQRFILFGDELYVEAYDRSMRDARAALDRIEELVGDNLDQQARARRLRGQASHVRAALSAIADLVRSGNRGGAEEAVRSPENEKLMDGLRDGITSFLQEEERLDGIRSHSLKAVQQNLRWAIITTCLLACSVTAILKYLFYRGISRRIAILNENARRLSEGRELSQPIGGSDEVAQLDRTFHAMAVDLTRSLAAQRDATERLNLALASGEVGTWSWNVIDDSLQADNYMDKLWGVPSGHFPKNLSDVFEYLHPDDRGRVQENLQQSIQNGVDYDTEYRLVRPDGCIRVIAARGKVDRDPQGRITRMAGVCLDLTARKQAEEEIRRLNAELEDRVRERTAELVAANRDLSQKNQENETFVYSVSHDLRSPLVNLEGFSQELASVCDALRELLTDEGVPEHTRRSASAVLDGDMAESIRYIKQAVARLGGIIDALLRLSRAGRIVYRCQSVDMQATISRVLDSAQATIAQRGVDVDVEPLPEVCGDPTALELVFANLVGNAVKYLDPTRPGRIEIGMQPSADAQSDPDMTTFYVRDNGLGIDPQYHEQIFQAFKRVHPKVADGEGMGLAIVRRIVERHRGKVWVASTAGRGSTFFVELPRILADAFGGESFTENANQEREEFETCTANR